MMRPDAKVQKVYLYPKPVDFRKSINGLAALVELDIKVEVFNPVLLGRWSSPVMTARPKKRMFFTKSLIDLVDIGCTADTPLVSVELRASNRVTASCFCVVCIGSRVIAGQRLRVTTQQKGGLTRPAISRACPLRTCLASHVLPHVSAR